jgi:hypothetical protein
VRRGEVPLPAFARLHAVEPAVTNGRFQRLVACVNRIEYSDGAEYCPADSAGWWPVDQEPRSLVEEVARELYYYARQGYVEDHPVRGRARVAPELAGAEWWVRLSRGSDDHPFHVDKSEILYNESGLLRHPYYGSVLYTGEVGGPTRLTNEWLLTAAVPGETVTDPYGFVAEREEVVGVGRGGDQRVDVKPFPNRYLLFPGWARHGVCPVPDESEIRRTVLLNWWCWRPPGLSDDPVFLPGEQA